MAGAAVEQSGDRVGRPSAEKILDNLPQGRPPHRRLWESPPGRGNVSLRCDAKRGFWPPRDQALRGRLNSWADRAALAARRRPSLRPVDKPPRQSAALPPQLVRIDHVPTLMTEIDKSLGADNPNVPASRMWPKALSGANRPTRCAAAQRPRANCSARAILLAPRVNVQRNLARNQTPGPPQGVALGQENSHSEIKPPASGSAPTALGLRHQTVPGRLLSD